MLITPLSSPNSASPSGNVFSARGLVTLSLCGSSTCTYSTSSAMFVTGIMRLFRSKCPRGVQSRTLLKVATLCNKSKALCLDSDWERLLKASLILGSSSSLSSGEPSLSLHFHSLVLHQTSLSFSSSRPVQIEGKHQMSNLQFCFLFIASKTLSL